MAMVGRAFGAACQHIIIIGHIKKAAVLMNGTAAFLMLMGWIKRRSAAPLFWLGQGGFCAGDFGAKPHGFAQILAAGLCQ